LRWWGRFVIRIRRRMALGDAKPVTAARECDCLGDAGGDPYTGVIVYMKTSLVGDEPADLLAYKLRHDVFPHDMTSNQWFTETQLKAYRRLGHHIAMSAIQPALSPERDKVTHRNEVDNFVWADVRDLVSAERRRWRSILLPISAGTKAS